MSADQNEFDRLVRALGSTISLKIVMAVTGAMLAGFVVVHMAGHLQVFIGRDAYNEYGAMMQSLGPIKWAARLGLLAAVGAHIGAMVALVKRNMQARPEPYKQSKAAMLRAYMAGLGMVLLAFIVYHLMHFTIPVGESQMLAQVFGHELAGVDYYALEQTTEDGVVRRDLYSHFVASFQNPLLLGFYVLAVLSLALHLAHGVTSAFKTIGFAIGRWRVPFELLGPAFAVFIGLGFLAPPLAVFVGIVH